MAAKLTIKRLLAKYETDPELTEVLGQVDKAIAECDLADLVIIMAHKDGSFSVLDTCQDAVRVLGMLAVAQAELLNGEEDA